MKELIDAIKEKSKACNIHSQNGWNIKGAYVDCIIMIQEWEKANCVYPVLGDGWRDCTKELPNKDGEYLIYSKFYGLRVADYRMDWNGWEVYMDVIAWQKIDPPSFA